MSMCEHQEVQPTAQNIHRTIEGPSQDQDRQPTPSESLYYVYLQPNTYKLRLKIDTHMLDSYGMFTGARDWHESGPIRKHIQKFALMRDPFPLLRL